MTVKLASKIVTAYLRANRLPVQDVPALIAEIARALDLVAAPEQPVIAALPAVPVARSVTPDAVICLECGARQKTLRRHLHSAHGLSPEEYRAHWNLPSDYPMVAPNYAKQRSQLARDAGLGRKPATVAADDEAVAAEKPAKGFSYPASRWSKPTK